jgi:hypothetical protein
MDALEDDMRRTADGLGDHVAARYRHVRGAAEEMDEDVVDHALFGLLLSAEGMRDEMRAYEEQKSWLLRLAQTGYVVRQIQRLNGVLDAIGAQYDVKESARLNQWEAALDQERSARVKRYKVMLASLAGSDADNENSDSALHYEIESEKRQEEVLTLLKAAIEKYDGDVLTSEETDITKTAFQVVANRSSMIVMSLPSWLVLPFEFDSSFGMSRWGNDVFRPDHLYSDRTRFVRDANTWSALNHPHVAKFLGACHVGSRPFIVHESVRALDEYVGTITDRQQVWRRLYEIALALQYLHTRGISCGGRLTLKDAVCAECEAKAMVLGVGHVGGGDDGPSETCGLCRDPRIAADDVEALGVLILNCLSMPSAPMCWMLRTYQKVRLLTTRCRPPAQTFSTRRNGPRWQASSKWTLPRALQCST